jgi:hypothetical protein
MSLQNYQSGLSQWFILRGCSSFTIGLKYTSATGPCLGLRVNKVVVPQKSAIRELQQGAAAEVGRASSATQTTAQLSAEKVSLRSPVPGEQT